MQKVFAMPDLLSRRVCAQDIGGCIADETEIVHTWVYLLKLLTYIFTFDFIFTMAGVF